MIDLKLKTLARAALLLLVPILLAALVLAALPGVAGAQGLDQPGVVTFLGGDPVVGTALSASLSDPDSVSGTPTWQWSRSGTRNGSFTAIAPAVSASSYTSVEADKAFFLQVTATYSDGHGANKTATATTELPVGVAVRSLVKNTQQGGDRTVRVLSFPYARFVTGDNPAGYGVTRVGIKAGNWVISEVSYIREAHGTGGAEPGPGVVNLRPSGTLVGSRVNWYDADEGAKLEPNTRYWLSYCCFQQPELISSHGEDSGGAHGWSIDNLYAHDYYVDGPPKISNSYVPVIDIKGFELLGPPGPPLDLSAAATADSLTLSWSEPGSLGHRPVTKYQTRSRAAGDFGEWTEVAVVDDPTATFSSLQGGNHILQVRAFNAQGAGAEAELVAATLRPGVLSVRASTSSYAPAGHRTTYGPDDTIVITVAFTGAVTVAGSPTFTFVLGSTDVAATYLGGSGTDELTFSYGVKATDSDSDGISWAADQLSLGTDDSITATRYPSLDATRIHAAQSAMADRLVDGSVTPNQPAAFPHDTVTLLVKEDAARGSFVGEVSASDPDPERGGGRVVYWTQGIPEKRAESVAFYLDFAVYRYSGTLWIRGDLDYESGTEYATYVAASDCTDRYGVSRDLYCTLDARMEVVVEVVDVDELGTGTIEGKLRLGRAIRAAVQDPDGSVSVDSWQWFRSSSRDEGYTPIAGADQASYMPTSDDTDKWLRAVATYSDGFGSGKTVTATAPTTVTIEDNDTPAWSVVAGPAKVAEGAASTVTVSVDKAFAVDQTITLAVGGTAASGDYSLSSSMLTLGARDTSVTATVTAVDDSVIEGGDETVVVTASHGGGAVGSATVTIEDNDTPVWSVVARPAKVAEGAASTVTVSVDKAFAVDQTITLVVGGTAASGDYSLSSSSLTLGARDTSVTATVTAVDDSDEESDETVVVTASHGGGAVGSATVTIEANDTPVSTDAALSSLALSGVSIGNFDVDITAYTASVGNGVSSTTVTAVASGDGASVVIADRDGETQGASRSVSLVVGDNEITVTVTAEDAATTKTYTITVARAEPDVAPLPPGVVWGDRLPDRDIALPGAGLSSGVWSDGTDVWVVTAAAAGEISVYSLADGAEHTDRGFTLPGGAEYAAGLWSDGATLWVADVNGGWVRAYRLSDGARQADRDLAAAGNGEPTGMWSDDTTMWVADYTDSRVYAYDLTTKARVADKELDLDKNPGETYSPFGIWSNGDTLLAASWLGGEIIAHSLADGQRQPAKDLSTVASRTNFPNGIWSNGHILWVVDDSAATLYAYAVPGLGTPDADTVENTPAEGEPRIDGIPEVGQTLSADTTAIEDADGLDNVVFQYQWLADDAEINEATAASYTLVDADVGKAIRVRVPFTDDAGNEEELTSAATGAVAAAAAPPNTPATGSPGISGTAQVGETLTADTAGISDGDGLTGATYTYQWLADDAEINGATAATYTLADADVGKAIRVKVTFTDDEGNAESLTSAATASVAARPNSQATGAPTISGTVQAGEALTASTSGIADDDGLTNVTYSYQWVRNDGSSDTDILGATDSTYTLVAADQGKTIKVKVSFTDDADNEETLTSTATAEVAAGAPTDPPGQPRNLTGVANSDGTVTLSWEAPNDGTVTGYQILRRRPSEGENTLLVHVNDTRNTATEYTDSAVTPAVLHAYRVKAINAVGLSSQSNFVNVTPGQPTEPAQNSPATGTPQISGTAQVGETLTASTSGIADSDGLNNAAFSYRWIRNDGSTDTDIQDATGASHTLVDADEGRTIKVEVNFADDAGNAETLTSAATTSVAARPNSPATGAPTISGTAQVGERLTADTSGIEDDDGLDDAAFAHQWLADDADIAGATGGSYILADADEGKTIKVQVSFTDDGGNDEILTSVATAAVAPKPNSPATGAPTISGTAQAGETLTSSTTGIADGDGLTSATFTYQWLADDADIAGATGSSYTLVGADEGKAIKVRASFTDDGGNQESLTSEPTAAVAEAAPTEPPPAPQNLTAVVNGDGYIVLSWAAPDGGRVTGYRILRRRPALGEDLLLEYVANTRSTAAAFTDTNVTPGVQHVYRVQAISAAGQSQRSNYVNVTP